MRGFTLLELMVVCAVIGVLIAIGVPQYEQFKYNAISTEAKIILSSLHTLERSFSIESGSYTACVSKIGFVTDTAQSHYYAAGFGFADSNLCGPEGDQSCYASLWEPTVSACDPNMDAVSPGSNPYAARNPAFYGFMAASTSMTHSTFKAGAFGILATCGAQSSACPDVVVGRSAFNGTVTTTTFFAKTDRWTINEQKQLER